MNALMHPVPARRALRSLAAALLVLAGLSACSHTRGNLDSPTGCATSTIYLSDRELALVDRGVLQCLADNSYPRAQLELGKRFEAGRGVGADPVEAAHWYARAAGLVQPSGAIPVPRMYLGVTSWVLEPDDLRGPPSEEARHRLGQLYVEGRGVPMNPEYGRKLMNAASSAGYRAQSDERAFRGSQDRAMIPGS